MKTERLTLWHKAEDICKCFLFKQTLFFYCGRAHREVIGEASAHGPIAFEGIGKAMTSY